MAAERYGANIAFTIGTCTLSGIILGFKGDQLNGTFTFAAHKGTWNAFKPTPPITATVTPDTLTMAVGDSASPKVAVKDAQSHTLGRPLTWSSADTTIAKVSAAGLVRAVAKGSTTLTVVALDIGKTVTVTVQ